MITDLGTLTALLTGSLRAGTPRGHLVAMIGEKLQDTTTQGTGTSCPLCGTTPVDDVFARLIRDVPSPDQAGGPQ